MKYMTRVAWVAIFALLTVAGCKKDEPAAPAAAKAPAASEAPAADAVKAPALAIAKPADVPTSVIAYGGIQGFTALEAMVGEIVAAFPGTPNTTAMMYQGIQASMMMKGLDWLDKGRPVYMVAFDPNAYAENALILLPLTKAEALAAALPDTKTGDAATGFSYDAMGKTFFLKVVKDYVVIGNDEKVYAAAEGFVTKTLLSLKPENVIEAYVPVKGIVSLYGKEIDEGMKSLDTLTQPGPDGAPAVPFLDANAAASLKGMANGLIDFAKSVEIVKVSLAYKDGTLALPVTGAVTAGSKAAETLANMGKRATKLYKQLPDGSYMTFAFNIDPTLFKAYQDLSLTTYKDLLKLSDEDMARVKAFLDKAYALSTGDGAVSVGAYGGFPLSVVMLSGVTDVKAYEKEMADFWTYFEPKLIGFLKAEIAKEGGEGGLPPIQGDTLQAVLDAFKPMLEPMGVKIELITGDLNGFKKIGFSVSVDYANPMWAANPEVAMAKALLGDKLALVCAGRKDNTYGCVFSPKADEMMGAFVDGKLGGGKLPVAGATADRLASASGFMTVDVAGALKQFTMLPPLAPMKAGIEGLKSADLYAYLRAAGNGFEAQIAVPLKLIAEVGGLFNKAGAPSDAGL